MLFVGDIHIYVSDFTLGLRFWADGLGLEVAEREGDFARLDFPDGGSSLRLLSAVSPWPNEQQPPPDVYPSIRFDLTTTDFDSVLARLIEYGGRRVGEVESYNQLRAVTVADPDGNLFELLEINEPA